MSPVYKTLLAAVLAASAFASQAAGDGRLNDLQRDGWRKAREGASEAVNPATMPRRSRNARRDRVRESGRVATPSSAPDRIQRDRRSGRDARRARAVSSTKAQRQIERRGATRSSRATSRDSVRRRSR